MSFISTTKTFESLFCSKISNIPYDTSRNNSRYWYTTSYVFDSRTEPFIKILIKELESFKSYIDKNSGSVLITEDSGSCCKIYGSTGRIIKFYKSTNIDKVIDILESCLESKTPVYRRSYYQYSKEYNEIEQLLKDIKVRFEFDELNTKGKKISSTFSIWNLSLTDINLDTKYFYTEPMRPNKKSLLDKFGREMEIGSLVIYSESISKTISYPRIGNITEISKTNTIYCKNIKLSETDTQSEIRIKDNQSIFLFSDDIKDIVSLSKLSF